MKGRKGKKENRPNETTTKARKQNLEKGCLQWMENSETNTMGTNQKIFSTNEHTINLSAIPQAGTILPSLLLMIENQFFH